MIQKFKESILARKFKVKLERIFIFRCSLMDNQWIMFAPFLPRTFVALLRLIFTWPVAIWLHVIYGNRSLQQQSCLTSAVLNSEAYVHDFFMLFGNWLSTLRSYCSWEVSVERMREFVVDGPRRCESIIFNRENPLRLKTCSKARNSRVSDTLNDPKTSNTLTLNSRLFRQITTI